MNKGHWSGFRLGMDEVAYYVESTSLSDLFDWIEEYNLQHDGDSEVIVISETKVFETYFKYDGTVMVFHWRIMYDARNDIDE